MGWVEAVVPGATFTSYVEAGLEPDPNFGDNAYKVDKEKYRRDYWYRTEIPTDSFPDGKHVWLCFEGINRKGDVWFNGSLLGTLDGFMDRGVTGNQEYIKIGNEATSKMATIVHQNR